MKLLLLLLCLNLTAVPDAQKPYSMLYVFGDSYSDSGAGYVDGNGPTAVVYLAERLGIPFTYFGDPHSAGKGLNFAISGAQTGENPGKRYAHGELLSRGMRNQVNDFAALVMAGTVHFDPRQTMFYLAGGLNDRPLPDGTTVRNLEADIDVLYAAGARRFEVALLPTRIPAFTTAGERFNPQLATLPAAVHARHPDVTIGISKWGVFFDTVLTHPIRYGITDTTSPCTGRLLHDEDSTPCDAPDTHFYYHAGHPSTAVHRAVGDMLYHEALAAR